jgi:hypothetical protein
LVWGDLRRFPQLQQVPEVSIKVLEHCDRPIALFPRLSNKYNAPGLIRVEISAEVVSVEEEKYASAGLIANSRRLLLTDRSGEQQPRFAKSGRGHHDPALVLGFDGAVFDQVLDTTVDQGRLGASQRMGPVSCGIEADLPDSPADDSRVLPCREVGRCAHSAREQEVLGL